MGSIVQRPKHIGSEAILWHIKCFALTAFRVHNRIYYRQTIIQTNKYTSQNSSLYISIKPKNNWVPLYKGPKHIGSEAILWHLTSRAFLSRPLEAAVAESRKPTRPTFGTRGREPRSCPAMNRGRAAKGQEGQQLTPAGTPNGRRHPRWRCCRYVKFQPVNAPQNAVQRNICLEATIFDLFFPVQRSEGYATATQKFTQAKNVVLLILILVFNGMISTEFEKYIER